MPNFALYCDWIIWDKQHVYVDISKPPKTIYVRSDINALNYFIKNILDKISSEFVLVTTSHDLPMPMGFHKAFNLDWEKIVSNPYLKAWVTENRDVLHKKIKPIPLGIPYPDLPSWVLGSNEDTVWSDKLFKEACPTQRSRKIPKIFGCWYSRANHESGTCQEETNERQLAYDLLIEQKEIFDWYPPEFGRLDFLAKMSTYQFVLCPHGGGLDPNPKCWEALILKSIPIVKRNTMSEALERLPVVILDDWSEITIDKMNDWSEKYSNKLYDDKLKYLMSNACFYDQILEYL